MSKMSEYFCVNILIFTLILINNLLSTINCVKLRGVSLESYPLIIKDGNQYKGYIIDVLNAMKNISDFNYYLYDANELGVPYITPNHTYITGLLGDVWSNNADFGVSDITVTEVRKRFVDFTDPLLNYSISALIHKSNVGHIKTFNQLADQTRITYGSLRNSSALELFGASNDMVVRRMHALMISTGVSVDSIVDAINKIKSSNYAFIGDSMTVDIMAKNNCDLTVIRDNRDYFRRHIAIALPRGSQILPIFNQVIKQLIESKRLDEIKDKYWKIDCTVSHSTGLIPSDIIFKSFLIPNMFFIGLKFLI